MKHFWEDFLDFGEEEFECSVEQFNARKKKRRRRFRK